MREDVFQWVYAFDMDSDIKRAITTGFEDDNKENKMEVTDFLDEFIGVFREQLESDQERWGDTWLQRTRLGQESRIEDDYTNYFDQYKYAGTPVPWLKVIGNAYIAWIRENHPGIFIE